MKDRIAAFRDSGVTHLNITPIPVGDQTPAGVVSKVKDWAS